MGPLGPAEQEAEGGVAIAFATPIVTHHCARATP